MPTRRSPRKGSLQFWPRTRAKKFLPRVNWEVINSEKSLNGFICYKAGMTSALVKDNTPDSMTNGKKIPIPVTLVECPPMKIFSARFYNKGIVVGEILSKSLDKELKRKVKLPKEYNKELEKFDKEYDDLRVLCYSVVKKTGLKTKPDMVEIGLNGSKEEKINFLKENLTKEFSALDLFDKGQSVDFRGLTKGKGNQGPVRRFGIKLKFHKSEKGRRTPGSLGPWHPARVIFRVPMAGQLGMFTRSVYNSNIVDLGNSEGKEELKAIKKYGDIRTDYFIIRGSIMGPSKRQLIMTHPLRETKKQKKKDFEFLSLLR